MTDVATTGLAPDSALPARDVLLDPRAVGAGELVRVKYRVGESLRVVYRSDAGGLVTGRMFRPGRSRTAYERALAVGAAPDQVRHDADLETVWWRFPRDRKLGDLRWLTEPDERLAGELGLPAWWRTAVVQYVPEKSLTARALDDGGRTLAYVKAYGPETPPASEVARRYRQVAAALRSAPDPVSAPDALAWSDERRVLLMDAMPGRRWTELDGELRRQALSGLGAAIALVHDRAPVAGLRQFGRLGPDRVARSADIVGRARPDVAVDADLLARRLVATRRDDAVAPVALHGDCHPGNALVAGHAVSLIDLDQMGAGEPAADLGSLLARLRYAAVVGELTPAEAADLETRFLGGYADRRPLPSATDLAWHTAAALLVERALRAVNRLNHAALAHLSELLGVADDTLDNGWLDLGDPR